MNGLISYTTHNDERRKQNEKRTGDERNDNIIYSSSVDSPSFFTEQ